MKDKELFFRFLIIGTVATAIDFIILYGLTEFVLIGYMYSATISYLSSMVFNYCMNKYFNFRNKSRRIISQFGLFATVSLIGLIINLAILYMLVNYAGMWYIYAKVIAVIVVLFWNFYGNKKLTFSVLR